MFRKITAIISGMAAILLFAGISFAATSVRLEQPKTPTNQNTFSVTFVALDTDSSSITVNCYKKGPNDSSFSQFGNTITLSNGGNTDSCSVDSSLINANGTYSFYVTANGVQSNTVSVDYNTSGPDTPTNYSKDNPTSCQYTISFKTAADGGKTVKVELYRSVNTSFNADSGSRVESMGIPSNTNGTFTDNVPDCNTTYYYGIRAFDSAGNGSGVVGDSQTITTVISPTGTQGANPQTNSAIPVVTNSVNQIEQPSTTPAENSQAAPGSKSVLGAKTTPTEALTSSLLHYGEWAALVIGLILVIYVFMRRRSHVSPKIR